MTLNMFPEPVTSLEASEPSETWLDDVFVLFNEKFDPLGWRFLEFNNSVLNDNFEKRDEAAF